MIFPESSAPPEATDGREETFDLAIFSSYEVQDVLVGDVRQRTIGSPTWKHLDRAAVESLVGQPFLSSPTLFKEACSKMFDCRRISDDTAIRLIYKKKY